MSLILYRTQVIDKKNADVALNRVISHTDVETVIPQVLEEGSLFFADLEKSMKEFFMNYRPLIMFKYGTFTRRFSQLLYFYGSVRLFLYLSVENQSITFEELEKKFPDKHFYDGYFYIEKIQTKQREEVFNNVIEFEDGTIGAIRFKIDLVREWLLRKKAYSKGKIKCLYKSILIYH
ncbi:MAG: hypothetical protein HC877_06095 [Thioploca sp.]|nr:hypothetical protein [Thioploca sp.]